MCYDYVLLGHRLCQISMEAGARWMLNDVAGKPIRTWDSRGHAFRTEYDALRRPVYTFVRGTDPQHADPRTLNHEVLFIRTDYGEGQPNDTVLVLANGSKPRVLVVPARELVVDLKEQVSASRK